MQRTRLSSKLWFGLTVALLLFAGLAMAATQNELVAAKDAQVRAIAERMLQGEAVSPAEKERAYSMYQSMVRERSTEPPTIDLVGGPDEFGYRFMDSQETNGPVFSWIPGGGTNITGLTDDNSMGPFPIGFSFSFYGNTYTDFYVGSNGMIQFGGIYNYSYSQNLPHTSDSAGVWLWGRDMHCGYGGTTVTYQNLTNPSRLVVTYDSLAQYSAATNRVSVQVILYQTGEVLVQYGNQSGTPAIVTAGIQNYQGSIYLRYVNASDFLPPSGRAVLYYRLGAASNPIPESGTTGVPTNTSLSWTAGPGAVSYDVLFGTVNPPVTVVSSQQTTLTYTPTLAASTTYYWQIVSRGEGGNTVSGPAWTFQTGTGMSPNAPSNGTISNATTTSLQVNWTDNSNNETGFPIHRAGVGGGYSLLTTAAANATSYVNTGLTPADRFFYRIYAMNGEGTSLQYALCNGWTLPNPAGMLTLGMAGAGHTTIQIVSITDDGNSANATYKIFETTTQQYVQADGLLGVTPAVRGRAAWAGTVVSGLVSGQSYSFRAVAMNGDGAEANGPISSITTNSVHVGGPDAFGYRYKDSEAVGGPVFNWITPSPNATTVTGWNSTDDGFAGPFDIGFTFTWYGVPYTQWMAGTNGRIQFGAVGNASSYWMAGPFPGFPGGVYFWNYDMSVSGTTVQYETLTGPNRLVVTYTNLRYLGGTFGIDAQVIVYQSGEVVTQFGPQTGTPAFAWSGIQNDQGSIYLNYPMMPTPSLAISYSLGSAQVTANVRTVANAPISGAIVQLLNSTGINAETLSNTQGAVVFSSVPAELYRLRAFATGYQVTTTDTFSVHDNDTIARTLTMQIQTANLNPPQNLVAVTGQVASVPLHWAPPVAGTGTVIGYRVYRVYGDTTMISYNPSATDTTFIDEGLMNGYRYQYFVKAVYNEGFSGMSNIAWAYPRPDNTMQFGNMRGRITNNETFAGVRGTVRFVGLARSAQTDTLGYYSFINVPVGVYSVIATATGWQNDTVSVTITQDGELTQNFVLESIGNAPPQELRTNGNYDDRVRIAWNAPGDNGIPTEWNKDTGVLTNAFYNPAGDIWNCTRFTPEGSWSITSMMCYFLHEGDPFWPWPNAQLQLMGYGIFLEDPLTNLPQLPPIWEAICPIDTGGWRIMEVEMAQYTGNFYLGVRSTTQGTLGTGNTDGIAMDAQIDYMGANMRQTTTGWEITDYGGWGDYMMRANGFTYGGADNAPRPIVFRHDNAEVDYPNMTAAPVPAAKVASTLTLGVGHRNVGEFAPRQVFLSLDSRGDERENPPSVDWLNGYRIYRNNALVATVDSMTRNYMDVRTSQLENTDAIYHVTATYTTAPTESAPSARDTVRFNMRPAAPTDLTAASDSVTHIILTWTAPTTNADGTPLVDLAGFNIYRNDSLVGTAGATATTYTDTPPELRVAYTYKVAARDEVPNVSDFSNTTTRSVQNYWSPTDFIWYPTDTFNNGPTGDDSYQTVAIGFPFTFYGNTFTNVVISTNGFITFDNTTFAPYWSPGIPNTAAANNLVCAVQADLYAQNAGQVKYYNSGGRFIYSCENLRFLNGVDSAGSFQIILEPSGAVIISYLRAPVGSTNPLSYAAGVENGDGTVGIQLYYNGALAPGYAGAMDGTAVGFWAGPQTMGTAIGHVYRRGGAPVEGASVSVFGNWNATTDATGRWELVVPARSWPLNVWKDCLLPRIVHTDSILPNDTTYFVDTLYQPRAVTDVTSLEFQVPAGETRSQTIILSNPGDYSLEFETRIQYSVADNTMTVPAENVKLWQRVTTPAIARSASAKSVAAPVEMPNGGFRADQKAEYQAWERSHTANPPAIDMTWGPDAFGYNALDNVEGNFPVWLSFTDISTIGTQVIVNMDDQIMVSTMDGFSFNYYGTAYTSIVFSSNGYIQFDATGSNFLSGTIPNANVLGVCAAYWRDLVTTVTKYYDAANNRFIIQWDGRIFGGNDPVQFQMQLHGVNGAIVIFYNTMSTSTATAGIQNADGTNNNYIACYNTAAPTAGWSNYGLSFTGPNGSWQRWALLDPANGVVAPNTSAEIFLQVTMPDTTPVGAVFSAQIHIETNACSTLVIPFTSTVVSAPGEVAGLPHEYKLHQNYPNPFNPTTEIRFDLKNSGLAKMTIYNMLGQEVGTLVNEVLPAGYHTVRFDAKSLAAGVYFYRIESGNFTSMKKMVLVK
ncbi:MAG: carboxypeptidase regulatory-like domain-containing protein [bacterium]|nr:carboxypeptidase regulatory-like domain-containing protein [bacterium]